MNSPLTPSQRDSKTSLLEAARAAVKDREEAAVVEAVARRNVPRTRRVGFLSGVGMLGLALLVLQPAWLSGPTAPPPETAPIQAASLRLTMLRERARVVDFRKRTGRWPESLTEAGGTVPEVHYERTGGDGFLLSGVSGDSTIVLRSTDSLQNFMGNSLRVIKNRGKP